jgi:hypothetical protein
VRLGQARSGPAAPGTAGTVRLGAFCPGRVMCGSVGPGMVRRGPIWNGGEHEGSIVEASQPLQV